MTYASNAQSIRSMRPLQGEMLVAAWERGSQQPQPLRALALLAAGCGLDEAAASALSLPERDAVLLALRQRSFGNALRGFVACSSCAERLEFTLAADDIAQRLDEAALAACAARYGDWLLHCRFATTADIAAAAAEPELAAARQVLLARCVSATHADGHDVPLADLPQELLAAADERLVAMHGAAELSISLTCPACEAMQDVAVDLTEFLWAETRHGAQRLLADVHELAWAYGWSESAILTMSAPRRAAYLALVRA
jgi:hypothetical protein